MVEIKGPSEAEARAREFIEERHFRVKQVLFRRVRKERNAWLLDGEVWVKRAYFFTTNRSFRLKMKPEREKLYSTRKCVIAQAEEDLYEGLYRS